MESLDWRPARISDQTGLEALLKSREDAWVSLVDRYWASGTSWHSNFAVLEDSAQPGYFPACFYLNLQGLAIIAVDPSYQGSLHEGRLITISRRRLLPLFCLMGPSESVATIQKSLPRETIASIHYYLMACPLPDGFAPSGTESKTMWPPVAGPSLLWKGLQMARSLPQDAANLIDLQIRYELEEVLVNGHRFDPDASRRQLEQSLQKQCIWHASSGQLSIAKAGTNARSWNQAQIGGVFTLPNWRNRGIGQQLMKAVLQDIFSAGLGACLFVKQNNAPAIRLYEKLGFSSRGALTISYY